MELPDCPPGAEGYQDSVTEVPKKKEDVSACTKAEQEFQDHLNSLKIKIEDDTYKCMVERRGRDVSGKWIYLCYPCAAVCSGEAILQTHISGKKHKIKLSMRNVWPTSIFSTHPYNQSENANKIAATPKVLKKMAEEVELFQKSAVGIDEKYGRLKDVRCHIQDTLDEVTAPLIGVEYLVEHPPVETHYEPSYTCTLCYKQGHPRTIVNHMTCFWHRHNYLQRHFTKAADMLKPFRQQLRYRDGVAFIMNRIAQRIVEKYGRMRPINIDKEEYEKDKEGIHQWIFKGPHYAETYDCTFEEVVDTDLINTLHKSSAQKPEICHQYGCWVEVGGGVECQKRKDPSPPVVAVPKPNNTNRPAARRERHVSMESLSDLSDDMDLYVPNPKAKKVKGPKGQPQYPKARYEPYPDKGRDVSATRPKYAALNTNKKVQPKPPEPSKRQPNYEHKVHLAAERRLVVEEAAAKSLAYHEKNPEKHPLYPDEWKKFWNRRYKEIQAEGNDPSKHDFKPEWIVYWTGRMKELHREELRLQVVEIYRKMCLSPPPSHASHSPPASSLGGGGAASLDKRRKSSDVKDARRRTPEHKERKRSPEGRRRSPLSFRGATDARRRSPEPRRRSPETRRRSPFYRRDHRSPIPHHRRSPPRRHSPLRVMRSRSRSPVRSLRSPARTHITLDLRGSRSPLSRRETSHRNRSPVPQNRSPVPRLRSPALRNRSPGLRRTRSSSSVNSSSIPRNRSPTHRNHSPATRNRSPDYRRRSRNRSPNLDLQTVLISDDELKPEDGASPWHSDNSLVSLGSLPSPPRSRTDSIMSRHTGGGAPGDSADNVVATLRTLVALEDYLGSLGPKVVDLLAEAIKMEKDKANSSEMLLERETAVVLIETAKEKLKGAAQAGLVAPAAAAAVRSAVVRAAATLHEADKRTRQKAERSKKKPAVVPVAGVGAVDRVQIAQQMAAALVAQGKTDVSEVELAQLVDAVVGMAEAKKREAEVKKYVSARSSEAPATPAVSETASALQMLQSAYDDKKCEKEDASDAMDGLSDSDLETLLKNFNELSAEEQHSLIAYLKKLEAREPQRVERLRQYVSAAAERAPARASLRPPAPAAHKGATQAAAATAADSHVAPMESDDDDDYTVEEVFKSVTAKVKEDFLRIEMEVVKKSLEETSVTASDAVTASASSHASMSADKSGLTNNLSSAANLLALVQASLQSANKSVQSPIPPTGDVVTSSTQPRSFGDKPDQVNPTESIIAPPPSYADRPENEARFPSPDSTQRNVNYINTPNESNEPRNLNMYNDPRFGANNPNAQNDPRFGANNPNAQNDPRFGANNPNAQNDPRFGVNNPNAQNDPRFGANNPNAQNDPRFGANNPNAQNDLRFGANYPNAQNDPRFGANNPNAQNDPRFGANNPNAQNDPRFGANNPNAQNDPRFGANNPNAQNDPRYSGNNLNMQSEPHFGANNSVAQNDPRFGASTSNMHGGYNPNMSSEPRYAGNSVSVHNGQNYANNPLASKDLRFGGNNPRMHNEAPYGDANFSYNGQQWEARQIPNVGAGPPKDHGYNNNPQGSSYNQGDRAAPQDMFNQRPQVVDYTTIHNNTTGGRMQGGYDVGAQSTNQVQYGNQNNYRGRGGTFINRGRGRGRGAWYQPT